MPRGGGGGITRTRFAMSPVARVVELEEAVVRLCIVRCTDKLFARFNTAIVTHPAATSGTGSEEDRILGVRNPTLCADNATVLAAFRIPSGRHLRIFGLHQPAPRQKILQGFVAPVKLEPQAVGGKQICKSPTRVAKICEITHRKECTDIVKHVIAEFARVKGSHCSASGSGWTCEGLHPVEQKNKLRSLALAFNIVGMVHLVSPKDDAFSRNVRHSRARRVKHQVATTACTTEADVDSDVARITVRLDAWVIGNVVADHVRSPHTQKRENVDGH